ncbi:MAG: GNAT family N-acetyltransferase [Lachnospiraceae bacterium]|nr:GNAT family N-acetyltransferase [Lachnospiraceae bacterium]
MEKETIPYQIRWAKPDEWTIAMNMIWKTFLKFEGDIYSPEGIRNFLDFITDEDLFASFLKGEYLMMLALSEGQIVGAATVRNGNHLSLLFVEEDYHRKGIGRALLYNMCKYLKLEQGESYMTVKAAPYAVEFYERIGFVITGPEEHYSGIQVTPMEKFL